MPKPKRVSILLSPEAHALLTQLYRTGLFGISVQDAAERLLLEAMREHVAPLPRFILGGPRST